MFGEIVNLKDLSSWCNNFFLFSQTWCCFLESDWPPPAICHQALNSCIVQCYKAAKTGLCSTQLTTIMGACGPVVRPLRNSNIYNHVRLIVYPAHAPSFLAQLCYDLLPSPGSLAFLYPAASSLQHPSSSGWHCCAARVRWSLRWETYLCDLSKVTKVCWVG